MGFSVMMNADHDGSDKRRPMGLSLFRPGHETPLPDVTLDLRTGREIFATPLASVLANPARVWESLNPVVLEPEVTAENGVFARQSDDPAAAVFDLLRTRVLQALNERGWKRIAVTSPTHGCGKSFVAVNLALALARRASSRTVLIDLELRTPRLADLLGIREVQPLSEFLLGEQPLESQFRRIGRTLALGLNGEAVPNASDLIHSPDTAAALEAMLIQLEPEVVIHDMPPALVADDVLALAPQIDAVLLVVDGTRTTPDEIRACERLFDGVLPILGVVLNRAQDRKAGRYQYGKV